MSGRFRKFPSRRRFYKIAQEHIVQLPTLGLVRWGHPVRRVLGYLSSPAPHYAPAIAFNAFIAIFPIALGLVALLVMSSPGKLVTREVEHIILEAFRSERARTSGT